MDTRERLKDKYIETSLRIEAMKAEQRKANMEWRRVIRNAQEMKRDILNRLRNGDFEDGLQPPLPGMLDDADGEVDGNGSSGETQA